ncbi:MAG: helix-hairpin-helix domain-containing protein [bacterium]|nr:helix-hairpin-helix domain-containing protein [bacterium]
MNFDKRQARITLLLFLFILIAGQVWLYFNRPIYPDLARFPEKWPSQGYLLDASALKDRALAAFPAGTTTGGAIRQLKLRLDTLGSGFCLPRAGVLFKTDGGWSVRPMSQSERHVWRIPMELSKCAPEDLERIGGIGPVLARKIHRFVQNRGYLESVEQLDAVPGIGPKKLEALKRELALQ